MDTYSVSEVAFIFLFLTPFIQVDGSNSSLSRTSILIFVHPPIFLEQIPKDAELEKSLKWPP